MASEHQRLCESLRASVEVTDYYPASHGFLESGESETITSITSVNPNGAEAANLIEWITKQNEALRLYCQHDAGCGANDLDPLDRTECSCGLRSALQGRT